MKIFITGGGGLVGRNLLEHPEAAQYQILAPTSKELNLLSVDAVSAYLVEHKPDIVIHCAGIVGSIQACVQNPFRFYFENSQIGFNIVNESRKLGIKNLINIGSASMYSDSAPSPLRENFLFSGELESNKEPYGLAKITIAKLCEFICRENSDYLYKTIIPCNLFGKFDKFNTNNAHFIPSAIKKIYAAIDRKELDVEIWGDGEAKRELLYASDLADFIFFSIKTLKNIPQNINVGTGKELSINQYYYLLADLIGYTGKFSHNLEKPAGSKSVFLDSSLARSFGWIPPTDLKDGLQKTIHYFLETQNHE